jgi:hypothetical protein
MNKNIWSEINFSKEIEISAYDLLMSQKDALIASTGGYITMEVEYFDIIKMYVVFPKLNGYRIKVISIHEVESDKRFPVKISSHIDEKTDECVTEKEFLDKVAEILSRDEVNSKILSLYQWSKKIH